MPMTSATAVVAAIVGNALISGVPAAIAFALIPPFGVPTATSTTSGTEMATMSGGWTIAPKTERRCTNSTAATQPRKYRPMKMNPSCLTRSMSMKTPMAAGTNPSSTAPHQGSPQRVPNAARWS